MLSTNKLVFLVISVALLLNIQVNKVEGASLRTVENGSDILDLRKFSKYRPDVGRNVELTDEDILQHLLHQIIPSYLQDIPKLSLDPAIIADELIRRKVSSNCIAHSMEWVYRISHPINGTIQNWVLHMIDAWGKLPEGLLSGHINSFGDFDECIELRAKEVEFLAPYNRKPNAEIDPNFTGRYCNVILLPSAKKKINNKTRISVSPEELLEFMQIEEGIRVYPSVATCFPSSCSKEDVQTMIYFAAEKLDAQIPLFTLNGTIASCYIEDKADFDTSVWSVVGLLSFIVGITVLATIVDYFKIEGERANKEKPKSNPGTALKVLLAFSVITNIKKWQSTGGGGGENFGCLHGMRFFSTLWVILAHTWFMTNYIPSWNMVDLKTIQDDWTVLTILNATIAVDTFFVMGGFLVAYSLLKMYQKTGGKLNYPMYVIHRYLRLTPTYAILVAIMATLIPYFGRGPYWEVMETWSVWCRDNWWTNLLYINNIVHSDKLCQAEAWYLSDDMQFYVLTPIIIYPLWKWDLVGRIIMGVATLLSIAGPGIQMYYKDNKGYSKVPTLIGSRHMGDFYKDIYIVPWARAQTYMVGLWLGYIFYKLKGQKVKLHKLVVIVAWLISTAISLSVLYGVYPYFDPLTDVPDSVVVLYGALNRFAFGLSVAWIIFACVHGYGGYVNRFLSWAPFIPLGRLTFSTYLVSLHLQMTLHLRLRQAITFDSYTQMNYFFSHMVMSLLVGFICTILLESPFIQLEKIIMPAGNARPPSGPKPTNNRNGIFYNTTESIINPSKEKESKDENSNNNNVVKRQAESDV